MLDPVRHPKPKHIPAAKASKADFDTWRWATNRQPVRRSAFRLPSLDDPAEQRDNVFSEADVRKAVGDEIPLLSDADRDAT
jgi:hypothetical protein